MNTKMTSKMLIGAIALALLTVYVPSVSAQSVFGGQIKLGDGDLTYSLTTQGNPFTAICFVDDDGSGVYEPGESVYATTDAACAGGEVSGNDLRLTPSAGQAAGTQVRASHTDFGNPFDDPAAGVELYDADGDSVYSMGDAVYIDMDGDAGDVEVGDIRLTPVGSFASGTAVAAGNSDINNPIGEVVAPADFAVTLWLIFDADGDGDWTSGDVAYIDADANDFVSTIDIRLGAAAGEPYGSQVKAGDEDLTYFLETQGNPFTAICFVDDDGSGVYEPGESVYATTDAALCGGEVSGNDLRLTPSAGQAAGTQVRASHTDFGNPFDDPGALVELYDSDGDSAYSGGDAVYLDMDGDGGDVEVGDVRLTPVGSFAAGSAVAAGNSDINNPLAEVAAPAGFLIGAWLIFDGDGDGDWTSGDVAYIDADANDFVSAIDIRLGANVGEPFGSQVTTGDADIVYALALPATNPFTAICFVDDDGSGVYEPGESVYATTDSCAGEVSGNDLRLTPSAGQGAGTQVRASHTDFGNPFEDPLAGVELYDADGDSEYSLGDTVYIDMDGDGLDVEVGDLRLTPVGSFGSGTAVAAGNTDINNPIGEVAAPAGFAIAAWAIFDADGDGDWTSGDLAYVDADTAGVPPSFVSVIDIRLGTTAPTTVSPPTTTPPTTTPPTTTPPTTTPPPTAEDPVARQDAADAKMSAEEAKAAAESAERTAQEAKTAAESAKTSAEGAKTAAEATGAKVDELADAIADDEGGTPGFGLFAGLVALAGAALYVGRRKR